MNSPAPCTAPANDSVPDPLPAFPRARPDATLDTETLPPPPAPEAEQACRVSLRFVDADNNSVEVGPLEVLTARAAERFRQLETVGTGGALELACRRGATLLLRSARFHLSPGQVEVPDAPTAKATILATRLVMLSLQVRYPDGTDVVGSVELEQQGFPTTGVSMDGTGNASVSGLADGRELVAWVWPQRAGFQTQMLRVDGAQVREGALISLELTPAAHAMGEIVLDLQNCRGVQLRIEVMIEDMSGVVKNASRVSGDEWRSGSLRTGRYIVVVRGGDGVWQSPLVEVYAGQESRLQPLLLQPARLRCTVLDADGKPLSGAVLTRGADDYVEFPVRGEFPGWLTRADAEGVAVLEGVPAGPTSVLIEAEGFEPVRLEAEPREGTTCELGEVRLAPATGRILVKLTGGDAKQEYRIYLHRPGGSSCRANGPIKGEIGEVVFEALPLRTYYIVVIAGKGGEVRDGMLELDVLNPERTIDIDVTGLKPDAE